MILVRNVHSALLPMSLAVAGCLLASDAPLSAAKAGARVQQFRLPLYFIENRGQADRRVHYYLPGRDTAVYFTARGVVVALSEPEGRAARLLPAKFDREEPEPRWRWALRLEFVGARPDARPEGLERTQAIVSYFKGPRASWRTGLATYAGVRYRDLWPGIDLIWEGSEGRLKSSFLVRPGADPSRIRLAWRGATELRLGPQGELQVLTPLRGFAEEKPVAWQQVAGRKTDVAAEYLVRGQEYSFKVGSYDLRRELVLDPVFLVYCGYIGGAGDDEVHGIAVDSAGNAYVTGQSGSSEANFPVTTGPDLTYNSSYDAFVAKVDRSGSGLVYAGYIGGNGIDSGRAIAVDSAGNAFVTGYTESRESTFPVTVGPDLTHNGGPPDAFVAKVNASGTALLYCGYIGGSSTDRGYGIAVDATGNAYVVGQTNSGDGSFPATVGPDLTQNGGYDAFVVKVNPSGSSVLYAGYIGGSSNDYGYAVAVDATGAAYVTGETYSSEATFPVAVGPDVTYNGVGDAFIAKVITSGNGFAYAGYIGGTASDIGHGIAVDAGGRAYVVGETGSSESSFPVLVGPDLTYNGYLRDAFLAKVNSTGTALVYAGYIGGSGSDRAYGVALDAAGNAFVAGATDSTQASFPVAVGPDLTHNGDVDAFVAKVNPAGTTLAYCGYLGGSLADVAYGVAVDTFGNAYLAGMTRSLQDSFPVIVGPDLTHNGLDDAFVAKVSSAAPTAVFRDTWGSVQLLTRYPTPQLYNAGGLVASDPAAAQNAAGDTFVVGRDNYNSIWANVFNAASSTWGGWSYGAGVSQGKPAVAVASNGVAYIVVRDNWNTYWLISYQAGIGFGAWTWLGGVFSTDPVMAACADGSVYIVGKDNWNSMWSGRYVPGSGLQGWQWGQGVLKGKLSATCGTDNVVYVVGRDNWDSLWLGRVQGNTWLGWSWGQGVMSQDPQAGAGGNGTIYVVVRDAWGGLWQQGYTEGTSAGWQGWVYKGGVLQDYALAALSGEWYVAGRDTSNALWWYRSTGNQWTWVGQAGAAAGPLTAAPK